MFIDVAGYQVNIFIPPLVAFFISILTSSGGISGAFLLLPFQMSVLGFTSPSVSSTNQLFNVVAIPGGVLRYIKEGRMVWPLTWIVVAGTLPGVFIGAIIRIKYLPNPSNFKIFAGFVLLYIGVRLVKDLISSKQNNKQSSESRFHQLVKDFREAAKNNPLAEKGKLPTTKVEQFNLKNLKYEFYGETFTVPTWKISLISLIVGIAGGAYGIGGGAIMAPFFVAFFRLPIYTISGATLMGTFVTSIAGVIFYQALDPFYPGMAIAPNWLLGLLFGIGGLAGIYLGARLQKYMPAKLIKWILAGSILFVALKYILRF